MNQYTYETEPLDLRLFCLLIVKKLWMIVIFSFFTSVLACLLLFVFKIIGPFQQFQAKSMFYIEFSEDAQDQYYNWYSWDAWLQSDELINQMYETLDGKLSVEQLRMTISADVESDFRMPSITVVTSDEYEAVEILKAAEKAVLSLESSLKEFEEIRIISTTDTANHLVTLETWIRTILLGMVVGFIISITYVILIIVWDSRIYLPNTLLKRYNISVLSTSNIPILIENFNSIYEAKNKIAVVTIGEFSDVEVIIDYLKKAVNCDNFVGVSQIEQAPSKISSIKEADGILVVVQAQGERRQQIEAVFDFLTIQNIKIDGLFLWGEDLRMTKTYYFVDKVNV